jgi:hypothetical protein
MDIHAHYCIDAHLTVVVCAAGRHIIKAISVGSKGADLIMADVGRKALMEEVNIGGIPHRIPEWILNESTDTLYPMSEDEDKQSTTTTDMYTDNEDSDSEDGVSTDPEDGDMPRKRVREQEEGWPVQPLHPRWITPQ